MAHDPASDQAVDDDGAMARIHVFFRRRVLDHKGHWLLVAICILGGEWLTTVLEHENAFQWVRNFAYQHYQSLGSRKGKSVFNAAVLIDDEIYWKDQWTPREPISRELLAALVNSVAEYSPAVIAIDIDLATGDPSTTTVEIPNRDGRPARKVTLHTRTDYGPETIIFLEAIESALAQRVEVVLTHEVGRDGPESHWTRFPNVYDGYEFGPRKPHTGHLFFDKDVRLLPLPVELSDGSRVNSLAIAAAVAFSPDTWANETWERDVLARLIEPDRLVTVSAHELLRPKDQATTEQTRLKLRHKIVWIGGTWHKDGYGRGTKTIDAHVTARGDLPGVLLHANYAESLLDEKLLGMGSTWLVEVPLAIAIALILNSVRWPWKWLIILTVVSTPFALSYVGVQNFGLYFDVFVISFLLILDVFVETVFGWYLDHRDLDRIKRLPLS